MENQKIIQVEEKVPFKMLLPLSIQHMFAMFGASVLVPFVFGINPAVVLFMNGIGTLLFILITKGKAPAYLGSSFAFLAPAGVVISKWGYEYALGGFVAVGFLGCILALIIYKFGSDWIHVYCRRQPWTGCCTDRSGTGRNCGIQCRIKRRGDRSEKCDCISCNFRSCSAWISGIP